MNTFHTKKAIVAKRSQTTAGAAVFCGRARASCPGMIRPKSPANWEILKTAKEIVR